MHPIPSRMEEAIGHGVIPGEFPEIASASQVFGDWSRYSDRVLRAKDGRLLVAYTTEMPGVSPGMIDWWFGWHMTETERYRLWHPKAHVCSRARENRSALPHDREKYIGNECYVDEYIGTKLMRLTIAFFDPCKIGIGPFIQAGATAICARTADRVMKSEAGNLVHLVVPTEKGSEMRSAFWLGDLNLQWPLIGNLLKPVINARFCRKIFVTNKTGTDLLRHCAEEMNHIPLFLPALYKEIVGLAVNHSL